MSKLRVALVLSGQPRFVDLAWSSQAHRRALGHYDLEVFGHMWFDESNEAQDTAPWSGLGSLSMPKGAPHLIQEQFEGGVFKVETPRRFDVTKLVNDIRASAPVGWPHLERELANLPNTASHMYSLHQALNLARLRNSEAPFDFFVLSRYDAVLGVFPKLEKLQSNVLYMSDHHDNFPDMVFVGSPNAVSSIDGWFLFETNDINESRLVGESVKAAAFARQGRAIGTKSIWMTSLAIRSSEVSRTHFYVGLFHYEIVRFKNKAISRLSKFLRARFIRQTTN